jgi:hypothetical protein
MIDVKSAVRRAVDYLREFHEFIPAHSIRLEETEYEDSGDWLITLSTLDATDPDAFPTLAETLTGPRLARIYKQFRIDAETGKVKSMKVRTLHPVD